MHTYPNISRIHIIQMLRGLAAVLVVLYHFRESLISDWPKIAQILSHGQIGVDIFFIISGFVIYHSTENQNNRKAGSFLIRRFFRVIVPAWIAMLLLIFIKPPYIKDLILSILFIPLKNSPPPSYGYNFLIVTWTLTYELIFYLIFSFAISFEFGRKNRGKLTCFLIISMIISIQTLTGTYTLDANATAPFNETKYFPMQLFSLLGNPLLLMFVIGIGLAHIYNQRIFSLTKNWQYGFLVVNLTITLSIIYFQYQDGHGLTNSGLLACLIVINALAIQSSIDSRPQLSTNRISNTLIYIGELSFSLYLIHPIVRSATMGSPAKQFLVKNIGDTWIFFMMLATSLVVSYIFYNVIEIPAQNYGKKLANNQN